MFTLIQPSNPYPIITPHHREPCATQFTTLSHDSILPAKLYKKRTALKQVIVKIFQTVDMTVDKDYLLYDIPLKTLPGYLFTFESGFHNPDKLVLIHGYFSSVVFYYKL
jgi:pimeloyl-ACP methyl ester carboxylesterase